MRSHEEEALIKQFPSFFKGVHRDMRESCMCWGMECGSGWFPILWLLNMAIERHLKYGWFKHRWYLYKFWFMKKWNALMKKQPKWFQKKCKPSHWNTIGRYPRFQIVSWYTGFEWTQIKEKYGTLRTYSNYGDHTIWKYVDLAERLSSVTCEQCGDWGKVRGRGWLYCSCEAHAIPADKEKECEDDA